jgi:anion-transporting  ArsA/GET3 family ATPase
MRLGDSCTPAGGLQRGNYDRGMATRTAKRDETRRRARPRAGDGGLGERLRGKSVCICLGAGGVGKTTTSAALALGLAQRGAKAAVVTIDPAARLASALGLESLPGEPHRIEQSLLSEHGIECKGELWAMMLDSKGTFDEIVARLAQSESEREEILANPIYRELSSAVAGSQELSAMVKLYELRHERDFDVIVLDTPPSRNALDFLDAPTRMTRFLEGRALKMFLAPSGLAARVVGRGTGLVLSMFSRFTGVDLLSELSAFFGSLASMVDGFRERAHAVEELLRAPGTVFLLVTSPEPEQVREAIFFAEQLDSAGMERAGAIVNRVHSDELHGHTTQEVSDLLAEALGEQLAARVAANLADFDVLAQRDSRSVELLVHALGDPEPILVPHLDHDICDLAGLRVVADRLFG